MVLGAIQQRCSDYYEAIPQGAAKAVIKNALYSFTISCMFESLVSPVNLRTPLIAAGLAATASAVHTLASPIFKYAFEGHSVLIHYQITAYMFDILVTQVLANLTSIKVDLFAKTFLFSVNLYMTGFKTMQYFLEKLNARYNFFDEYIPEVSECPIYISI